MREQTKIPIRLNIFLKLLWLLTFVAKYSEANNIVNNFGLSDKETVELLVKQWAPLVWLAPGEKFQPAAVTDFLQHVHAEKSKTNNKNSPPKYYYDGESELSLQQQQQLLAQQEYSTGQWERRNKRNFREENLLMDYIIDMPIGDNSENWFLVTNDDIDDLLDNDSSFIYGQNPIRDNVPIYAMVSMCSSSSKFSSQIDIAVNDVEKFEYKRNPYIPLTKQPMQNFKYFTSQDAVTIHNGIVVSDNKNNLDESVNNDTGNANSNSTNSNPIILERLRRKRNLPAIIIGGKDNNDRDVNSKNVTSRENGTNNSTSSASDYKKFQEWEVLPVASTSTTVSTISPVPLSIAAAPIIPDKTNEFISNYIENYDLNDIKAQINNQKQQQEKIIPHFHVTYWMFYPYSQGKTMCSISLGPLGRVPIPLIFGMCLGTRRDFGSHVGDWEHMSLFFRGRMEPEEMYVSAHDAGAYYGYDRLTGTFEFRSQETRVGILQKPVFPRTVLTSSNHPVLFAAQGSHGLWTAPGKHRFVRVPRLYDVNGFGIPWSTWQNTEIIYEDELNGRSSMQPHWIHFQGRWGNPKSKCHPLRKIGLHFCEYSDGPTGIPKKTPHFYCTN